MRIKFINRRLQARRRKLWVKALRSGEYDQTRQVLRDEDGFCCLGVGCDVYSKETGKGEWVHSEKDLSVFGFAVDGKFLDDAAWHEQSVLPYEVMDWFGLTESRGELLGTNGHEDTLTEANDVGELSFNEIADLIENGEVEVQ